MRKTIQSWALGLWAVFLLGYLSCAPIPNGGGSSNAPGILYAIDSFNIAVYAFDNALTLNGAVTPTRTISGNTNSQIAAPTALVIDGTHDILYVADSSAQEILAFSPASTTNGDVAPIRTYPGVVKGGAMFYDDVNDRLFVTDTNNQLIKVWDQISTLLTGTQPNRSITLGYVPTGIFVDRQRDLLYVGDPASQGVKVYDKPSTLSTNSTALPTRTITDSSRPLQNVSGLTMNMPNDILFVTESSNIFSDDNNPNNDFLPSVEMFDNVSTLNGAVPANRELDGTDTGLSVDTTQPHFFVANSVATLWVIVNNTTINVWNNANQLSLDIAPDRSLQISTANARISNFDVDLAH